MSQPSRPRAQGTARRRRDQKFDAIMELEDRRLMAPYVATFTPTVTFTAATSPTNDNLGTVAVTYDETAAANTAAPITSVAMLTSNASFGGDIVRIEAGPGGVFGNAVYAISRGAGGNIGAVNRPGVIYRVDPATGKASVFFDLNTVLSQIDPNATKGGTVPAASASGRPGSGLVNWYDLTFDSEGYFDGKPSLFVSMVDSTDPYKNAIYRIAPNGDFMGMFTQFTQTGTSQQFLINPSAMTIPGPENQAFLRGLISGSGATQIASAGGGLTFAALYFDSNKFSPGQAISNVDLVPGVSQTSLIFGAITGLTTANADYASRVYSVFTDFGTPAAPHQQIPGVPGLSGVQGLRGGLLITGPSGTTDSETLPPDQRSLTSSNFRRFQDVAFDQYGYFSQSLGVTFTGGSATAGSGGGADNLLGTFTSTVPAYAGSLFVADLASGLSTTVTPVAPFDTTPISVPVQGSGTIGVTTNDQGNVVPILKNGNTTGTNVGGRILRILPDGTVTVFAAGFDTSGDIGATSFEKSSLSITFSADGTTLYASDDDGIWQFKTTASLAGSTTGTLIGLNDLRSLGVPYDGQGSAVAVVDTGITDLTSPFRGRIARGTNIITGGPGTSDTASNATTTTGGTNTGGGGNQGGTGGTGGTSGTGSGSVLANTNAGHGTPVAGVIAQFVPQATLVPISIFVPFVGSFSPLTGTSGGGNQGGGGAGGGGAGGGNQGGGNQGGGGGTSLTGTSNALTTTANIYNGLQYVTKNPFVNDPVRPGRVNRIIATNMSFGTTETFTSEGSAYKRYPQIVIALKNVLKKYRRLGIAPIAAAGEFGAPLGAGTAAAGGVGGGAGGGVGGGGAGGGGAGGGGNQGGGTGGTGTSGSGAGLPGQGNNSADGGSLGDVNGMALPAVLNEVLSVTGSYSYPFTTNAASTPNDPVEVVYPNVFGPLLIFGNVLQFGFTSGTGTSGGTGGGTSGGNQGGTGGTGGTTGSSTIAANVTLLTGADSPQYPDQIVGAANRSSVTDFAAPAVNVPTFARFQSVETASSGSSSGGTGGTGGNNEGGGTGGGTTTTTVTTNSGATFINQNVFDQVGTSMSSAIVTGSYAMVASALDYWITLGQAKGVTSDAYLTVPVGARTLNFGRHSIKNLSMYNRPDGINGILAYTAVPATDSSIGYSLSTPSTLIGSSDYKSYARVDVGNAIAAIEGTVAINYLLKHRMFGVIDTNHDRYITAQEMQDFQDNAAAMGLAEAGAMARLLGGTASIAPVEKGANNLGGQNENPEQTNVLQRRFNFFDYVADGNLNGSVSISSFRMLSNRLLPKPDSYVIVDRQRASANGFLVAPATKRNLTDLRHVLPKYQWVTKAQVAKFRGVTPAAFGVDKGLSPLQTSFPLYTLFAPTNRVRTTAASTATTTPTPTPTPAPTPPATAAATPQTSTTTTPTPAPTTTSAQDQIIQAITDLANRNPDPSKPTTTLLEQTANSTLGTMTPAGTVGDPSTTPSAAEATAAATETPAPTPNPSETVAAAVRKKASAKKSSSFFDDLWDSVKKPFS